MPGSVTILSRTTNGSAAWEVPIEARSQPITFRAIAQGSGAVAGSVAVHQGSTLSGTVYYDTTAATTLATSWPNLVPAESEDNIHSNRDGGFRAGPLAADIFLARAAEYYPELT